MEAEDGRVAKRTSSRLRRTNDRSALGVHEDHEDDENAEIGVSLHAQDTFYLGLAAKLAKLGEAKAFPNPIVGAVIVYANTIIGEGFHQKYGEAHAEPNAIKNLTDLFNSFIEKKNTSNNFVDEFSKNSITAPPVSYLAGAEKLISVFNKFKSLEELIHQSTIYVSLEPCNHYGKTAPCTKLIHRLAFKRLVYACHDPNPLLTVHDKYSSPLNSSEVKAPHAVKRFYLNDLKESGMDILCLEDYANSLSKSSEHEHSQELATIEGLLKLIKFDNRIFFEFIDRKNKTDSEKRSKNYWLTLKVASYPDGSMETKATEAWITNSSSRKDVQRLRATHEILITGINTIKNDNPLLNVRFPASELNLSDICDREIVILKSSQDFNETEKQSLNIFSSTYQQKVTEFIINPLSKKADNQKAILRSSEFLQSEKVFPNLRALLNHLSSEKKLRIMVEAGPNLMKSFLQEGLVDEIIHYEPLDIPLENYDASLNENDLIDTISSRSLSNILDRYQNLLKESPLNTDLCSHRSNEILQQSQKCYLSKYEIIEATNINERADIKVLIRVTKNTELI
ncbi:MAG: dihydrofolate reductase family protein [Cyanobacteria bacterium REEB446]|nr:dihydrofolate reductase family protein [Cyanobacteria bacterium REEB446]